MKRCAIPGCEGVFLARGWCGKHYYRWRVNGDPEAVRLKIAPFGEPMKWLQDHVAYKDDGCLIWPFAKYSNGYPLLNGEGGTRLMCELVYGPAPTSKHEAAHSCGNGHNSCIHPQHLRWATKQENEDDKILHGRKPLGEKHWNARLTADWVREIRRLKNDLSVTELGERFGVSDGCIRNVLKGNTWRHIS